MDEDIEDRRQRLADLLDYSADLKQRTADEMAEPRAVMAYETPRQIRMHDAHRIEHDLNRRLTTIELRLNDRLDAIEARQLELSATIQNGIDGLTDVTGSESGLQERRLRDEFSKEMESLRGEIALLRTQKSTPRKTISRAPFQLGDENASLRN